MRSLATVAAGVAAVVLLSGCGIGNAEEASPAKPKSPAAATSKSDASFNVEAALKGADSAPYSAEMKTETYVGPTLLLVMTGRVNFNGPALTGKLTMATSDNVPKDQAMKVEAIVLGDATYSRMFDGEGVAGEWQRTGQDVVGVDVVDFSIYAQLLLDLGPKARKGLEEVDGSPAYRLSGNLTADQVRTVDRRLYDKMRSSGTKEFAGDVWINEAGRVVRFEQWMEASGQKGHNVVTLKMFRTPVSVSAPE